MISNRNFVKYKLCPMLTQKKNKIMANDKSKKSKSGQVLIGKNPVVIQNNKNKG